MDFPNSQFDPSSIPEIFGSQQRSGEETRATDEASNQPSGKDSWIRGFRQTVGSAITELARQGLIREGRITAHAVSKLSKSSKLGTITAVRRLMDVGIIRKTPNINEGNTLLDAADIVAMYILNSNRKILGLSNRPRQREALKILRESVASYLAKQRAERQQPPAEPHIRD